MRRPGKWGEGSYWGYDEAMTPLVEVVSGLEPETYKSAPVTALRNVLERAFLVMETQPLPETCLRGVDTKMARTATGISRGSTYAPYGRRLLGLEEHHSVRSGTRTASIVLAEVMHEVLGFEPSEGTDRRARNDLTRQFRSLMASALRHLEWQAAKADVVAAAPVGTVRRAGLIAHVLDALDTRARACIWGYSGDGKTTLVQTMIDDHFGGRAVVYLDFASSASPQDASNAVHGQLIQVLVQLGREAHDWSAEACFLELRELLARPAFCDLVVFDDIVSSLAERLAGVVKVPLVLVGRYRFDDSLGPSIYVGEYHRDEALTATKHALPHLREDDLATLCQVLGDRPLPLSLAATAIAKGHVTVTEIASLMPRLAPETLDALEIFAGRDPVVSSTVYGLYAGLLTTLEQNQPAAWDALVHIAWLCDGRVDSVREMAQLHHTSNQEAMVSRASLTLLRSYGLLSWHDGDTYAVNDLTLEIVRWQTRDVGLSRVDSMADIHFAGAIAGIVSRRYRDHEADFMQQIAKDGGVVAAKKLLFSGWAQATYLDRIGFGDAGTHQLSGNTWLFWQSKPIVCSGGAGDERQAGLLIMQSDGSWRAWTAESGIVLLDDNYRAGAFAVTYSADRARRDAFQALPSYETDPEIEPEAFCGYSLAVSPVVGLRHRLLAPESHYAWAAGAVWARCGRIFHAAQLPEPDEDTPQCFECEFIVAFDPADYLQGEAAVALLSLATRTGIESPLQQALVGLWIAVCPAEEVVKSASTMMKATGGSGATALFLIAALWRRIHTAVVEGLSQPGVDAHVVLEAWTELFDGQFWTRPFAGAMQAALASEVYASFAADWLDYGSSAQCYTALEQALWCWPIENDDLDDPEWVSSLQDEFDRLSGRVA